MPRIVSGLAANISDILTNGTFCFLGDAEDVQKKEA